MEIDFVYQGRCRFPLPGMEVIANRGEYVFRYPEEPRRKYALDKPTIVYWATFDGDGAEAFFRSFGYPRGALRGTSDPVRLFEKIRRGLASPNPDDYAALIAVYAELIAGLSKRAAAPSPGGKLAEACLYRIGLDYADASLNVDRLAEELGVHRSTLHRAVRNATGMSPIRYLEHCRIEHALELLSSTFLPVSKIARDSGFTQTNYFCRRIRATTGRTPLQYRKKHPGE